MDAPAQPATRATDSAPSCPVDHGGFGQQKTSRTLEPAGRPAERDAAGVWHIYSYAQTRAVLRSADTRQAGFSAERVSSMPSRMTPPILFQDGLPHHEQRRLTARYFTPVAVKTNYRGLMERYVDQAINTLRRKRRLDLSNLTLWLAVRVAAQVIGLTNSRVPGMDQRLNAFFAGGTTPKGWRARIQLVQKQLPLWSFFWLDVKPAIAARRANPQEDVISHLIEQGRSDMEILTECVTYGAAGMATTREFISVAAWHLIEQPRLRDRYRVAGEVERHAMLQEILRLEPVVGHLYRRATADITLDQEGTELRIPNGSLIDLHVYAANADPSLVGEHPLLVCPARELTDKQSGPAAMSFGDGSHRCPGSYIAIQETDLFLQQLLKLDGLQIEQKPSVAWHALTAGYEVRDFILSVR